MVNSTPRPAWHYVLLAIAGLSILGTVFGAGFFIGRSQARSSVMIVSPLPAFPTRQGHGAIGKITEIEGNLFSLQKHDGTIKTIMIDNRTRVESDTSAQKVKITARDLKIGDRVIVVGTPDDRGQIRAIVIRVLPALPLPTPTPRGL